MFHRTLCKQQGFYFGDTLLLHIVSRSPGHQQYKVSLHIQLKKGMNAWCLAQVVPLPVYIFLFLSRHFTKLHRKSRLDQETVSCLIRYMSDSTGSSTVGESLEKIKEKRKKKQKRLISRRKAPN